MLLLVRAACTWNVRLAATLVVRPGKPLDGLRPRGVHPHPRRYLASMATSTSTGDEPVYTGQCYCKACSVQITGSPSSVSICHCSTCRVLSGAPFTSQVVVKAGQLTVTTEEGGLVGMMTSPQVTRYRCKQCGSPVYASLLKGKVQAIPLSMIAPLAEDGDTSLSLAPQLHMHYEMRITDVRDELPKFVGSANRKQLWTPPVP